MDGHGIDLTKGEGAESGNQAMNTCCKTATLGRRRRK